MSDATWFVCPMCSTMQSAHALNHCAYCNAPEPEPGYYTHPLPAPAGLRRCVCGATATATIASGAEVCMSCGRPTTYVTDAEITGAAPAGLPTPGETLGTVAIREAINYAPLNDRSRAHVALGRLLVDLSLAESAARLAVEAQQDRERDFAALNEIAGLTNPDHQVLPMGAVIEKCNEIAVDTLLASRSKRPTGDVCQCMPSNSPYPDPTLDGKCPGCGKRSRAATAGTKPATPSLREHRHICTDLECSGDCVCGICGVPFATRDEDDWVLDPSQEEQLQASGAVSEAAAQPAQSDRYEALYCEGCRTAHRLNTPCLPAPAGLPTPYTREELPNRGEIRLAIAEYGEDVDAGGVTDGNAHERLLVMCDRLFATARLAVEAQQDTVRVDFLQAQGFTKWVGYGTSIEHTVWPVFPDMNLRDEIDRARRVSGEASRAERQGHQPVQQRSSDG